jgi:hypothetical protein
MQCFSHLQEVIYAGSYQIRTQNLVCTVPFNCLIEGFVLKLHPAAYLTGMWNHTCSCTSFPGNMKIFVRDEIFQTFSELCNRRFAWCDLG